MKYVKSESFILYHRDPPIIYTGDTFHDFQDLGVLQKWAGVRSRSPSVLPIRGSSSANLGRGKPSIHLPAKRFCAFFFRFPAGFQPSFSPKIKIVLFSLSVDSLDIRSFDCPIEAEKVKDFY